MYRGYIKLYRKSVENPLYFEEKFTRWQAWCDLLLIANHKPGIVNIRGNLISINRGQVVHSEATLAERWKWSRWKVRRYLKYLKTAQQIEQHESHIMNILTIINYDSYHQNGTTDRQQTAQQTDTNNNDKNDKNDKNTVRKSSKFTPPNIEEITKYIKDNNYQVNALTFLKYFTESNWIDSKGQKVRNWKQKVITWNGVSVKTGIMEIKTTTKCVMCQKILGAGETRYAHPETGEICTLCDLKLARDKMGVN